MIPPPTAWRADCAAAWHALVRFCPRSSAAAPLRARPNRLSAARQAQLIEQLIGGLPGRGDRARPRRAGASPSTRRRPRSRRRCAAASRRSIGLRMPELVDAIRARRDAASRSASNFSNGCRSTAGSEAFVTPVRDRRRRRDVARPRADDLPRSHPAAAGRGDARRLRRQCQPRAAHAARRAARLHRNPAGSGQRRSGRARTLPRHHAGAGLAHGAADRRSAVAVAHRAERASAAGHAGRSCRRSCARWSTGCRRWRATATSRSRWRRRRSR